MIKSIAKFKEFSGYLENIKNYVFANNWRKHLENEF